MMDALLTKMRPPTWRTRSAQATSCCARTLLRTDVFTFTVPGAQWLNQQWGAQLFLDATYRLGGWNAMVLMHAALTSLSFAFIFLACRRRGASTRTAALLSVAGFWVARQNLAMRPQLIGVLLFSITLWILAGRRTHPRALWAIPILMLIWVNVHGSFVLAPLLLGLAWLEDRKDSPDTARALIAVCGATLAATLANPFGLRVWAYAAAIGSNPTISARVTEWAPPTVHEYSGVVFFVSALIIVGYLLRRGVPVGWPPLIWLATFFVLALPALRGVVWWGLAFPVVLAGLAMRKADANEERGSPFMNALLVTTIAAAVLLVMPFWRGPIVDGNPRISIRPHRHWYRPRRPDGACSRLFVSEHTRRGRVRALDAGLRRLAHRALPFGDLGRLLGDRRRA
jgi:hypothetical protein